MKEAGQVSPAFLFKRYTNYFMTGNEFLEKTKDIKLYNYDTNEEHDYMEVECGHTVGTVSSFYAENGVIVLSVKGDWRMSFQDEDYDESKLKKVQELCKEHPDYPMYYDLGSTGVFTINDARKVHYDYSWDGDGKYDALLIECSNEPVYKDIDALLSAHIDFDSYVDMYESIYLNSITNTPNCDTIDSTCEDTYKDEELPF